MPRILPSKTCCRAAAGGVQRATGLSSLRAAVTLLLRALLITLVAAAISMSRAAAGEGISESTLYHSLGKMRAQGRLLPDADTRPEGWSSADKFAAALESAAFREVALAEYCRKCVLPG